MDEPEAVDNLADRRYFREFGEVQAKQAASLDVKFDRLELGIAWIRGQFTNDGGLLVGLSSELANLADNVAVVEVNVLKVEAKVDAIEVKVGKLEAKVDAVEMKVGKLEAKVDAVEVKVGAVGVKVDKLQVGINAILDRLPARAA